MGGNDVLEEDRDEAWEDNDTLEEDHDEVARRSAKTLCRPVGRDLDSLDSDALYDIWEHSHDARHGILDDGDPQLDDTLADDGVL